MKVTVFVFLIVLSETTEEYRVLNNALGDKVNMFGAVEPECKWLHEVIDRC